MSPRIPFVCFLGLGTVVALGLAALPPLTAVSWITTLNVSTLPTGLQAAWIAWFFALWGALVAFMISVGAWTMQELSRSEKQSRAVAEAVPARGIHAIDGPSSLVAAFAQATQGAAHPHH